MICRPASRRRFANSARVSGVARASTWARALAAPRSSAPNRNRMRAAYRAAVPRSRDAARMPRSVPRVLREQRVRRELLGGDVLELLVGLARAARAVAGEV